MEGINLPTLTIRDANPRLADPRAVTHPSGVRANGYRRRPCD
jgi:hypothetical protein